MATKKQTKSITVELGTPQAKKSVTRFDASADDAAMRTAYVSKQAMDALGNPESIRITIEAA